MILIDTHIWIWWVSNSPLLKKEYRSLLENANKGTVHISIISCWEVAKAVETGKLKFNISVDSWLKQAIDNYAVNIIPLDMDIIVDSTRLSGSFHKDPADQIIVATARCRDYQLITQDRKILEYPHVKLLKI